MSSIRTAYNAEGNLLYMNGMRTFVPILICSIPVWNMLAKTPARHTAFSAIMYSVVFLATLWHIHFLIDRYLYPGGTKGVTGMQDRVSLFMAVLAFLLITISHAFEKIPAALWSVWSIGILIAFVSHCMLPLRYTGQVAT